MMSPFQLLQEELCHDPWKMLIGCKLLNRTYFKQVRDLIWKFFERWPSAGSVVDSDFCEMAEMLRPLGFYNRRSRQIIQFSKEYDSDNGASLPRYHGVGKYGEDSYKIFCLNDTGVKPTDKKLIAYLNWARQK